MSTMVPKEPESVSSDKPDVTEPIDTKPSVLVWPFLITKLHKDGAEQYAMKFF